MPKSKNYTEQEFDEVKKNLEIIGFNDLPAFEALCAKIGRDEKSLYNFIVRKFSIDIFPDPAVKKKFRQLYCTDPDMGNKPAKKYIRSGGPVINDKPAEKFVRAPSVYSNFDHRAWANRLLDD